MVADVTGTRIVDVLIGSYLMRGDTSVGEEREEIRFCKTSPKDDLSMRSTDFFALNPVDTGMTDSSARPVGTADNPINTDVDIVVDLHAGIAERIETRTSGPMRSTGHPSCSYQLHVTFCLARAYRYGL